MTWSLCWMLHFKNLIDFRHISVSWKISATKPLHWFPQFTSAVFLTPPSDWPQQFYIGLLRKWLALLTFEVRSKPKWLNTFHALKLFLFFLKCLWNKKYLLIIWEAFQSKEELRFTFWNIFVPFSDIWIFLTTVRFHHAPTIWKKLRWKSPYLPILKSITEIIKILRIYMVLGMLSQN